MRPIAVGRKNWIHVGSAQAEPKVAAILSIVESCRRRISRFSNTWQECFPDSAISRFYSWPTHAPGLGSETQSASLVTVNRVIALTYTVDLQPDLVNRWKNGNTTKAARVSKWLHK